MNGFNMNTKSEARFQCLASQAGFSLIELMIAVTLGLIITTALAALFLNISRTNDEMTKTNSQIENGRFTMQLLQEDIIHAGFWGPYNVQFNDPTYVTTPLDAPTAVPNPCLLYSTPWSATDVVNLIGINIQTYGATPPAGTGCVTNLATNKQSNTDVLVVRHAETCAPGETNCEAHTAGKLYFQASQCEDEITSQAQAGSATSITLSTSSSATTNFYVGRTVRILAGGGLGQARLITAYNGTSKVATVSPAWDTTAPATVPDINSIYSFGFGYLLDTSGFTTLHKRNCTTVAEKRKFISNIYYVRDYAKTVGDGIPTLMLSSFDLAGGALKHQEAQPLIEGIEGFQVELGIDNLSKAGANIIINADPTMLYTNRVRWDSLASPTSSLTADDDFTKPLNRGDGVPDAFVKCTDATPCDFKQLSNVVAVKLYVLARADKVSPGYTDTKTYALGSTTLGPYNDGFKRHVFSTTVRVNNVSSRRETP